MRVANGEQGTSDLDRQVQHGSCRQIADIQIPANPPRWYDRMQAWLCWCDTNGAGDMFAGAFLFGLSQNWSFEQAGKLANNAAAQVVSQYGPRLSAAQYRALL